MSLVYIVLRIRKFKNVFCLISAILYKCYISDYSSDYILIFRMACRKIRAPSVSSSVEGAEVEDEANASSAQLVHLRRLRTRPTAAPDRLGCVVVCLYYIDFSI